MAVAEAKNDTNLAAKPIGLVASSFVGATFVLVAAAVILRVIPSLWAPVESAMNNSFLSTALLMFVQVAAMAGLIVLGSKLGAKNQHTGIRGGIFLAISSLITVFFCLRALQMLVGRGFSLGMVLGMVINVVLLFLVVQLFRKGYFTKWSQILDDAGWFSTETFKRTQGLRIRRLTILGILVIAGSGIWTLMTHDYLPRNSIVKVDGKETSSRFGDWVIGGEVLKIETAGKNATDAEKEAIRIGNAGRPRIEGGFTVLPDLYLTLPLVLIVATLWFSWRAVNYPQFTDFLIATEAEMNKVSWTPRKALIRDTIVVLTSLVIITVFLFVVDVFWNWLLSRNIISVLPTEADKPALVKDSNPVTEW
jgi:preprotein translocase SecE subunit